MISMKAMLNLKSSKKTRKCNAMPRVWQAIAGCTGTGNRWRYDTYYNTSRNTVTTFCPACEGFQAYADSLNGADHQAFLREVQAAAGVENYRYQKTAIVNGRPVLVKEEAA
jgi:hypothetical protein